MSGAFSVFGAAQNRGDAPSPDPLPARGDKEKQRGADRALLRHCEEPTGPREARPDDRLRDEAIQTCRSVEQSGLLRFARNDDEGMSPHSRGRICPSDA